MTGPTATPPAPRARVLVVDDEAHVRSALTRSLTLLGYRADAAASGYQALEMLERAPYDAMVLDIHMPGMDGVEVMERACQACPDLSIVLLTGRATLESAIAAVRSHAADYLLKPASVHDIAAVIDSGVQQRAEKLRRQHLLQVMGQTLDEVRRIGAPETPTGAPPTPARERLLSADPVTLDRERRLVVVAGGGDTGSHGAELTVTEAVLLAYLMQRPGAALSCGELARSALGYDVTEKEAQGIVRPHICRLRKKIEPDPAHPCLIRTISGQGYLFAP
jgi:DNA-binding response OmpR family regulator